MGAHLTEDQRRGVGELFARYGEGVGSFVLARVGDEELAEEITARVFLRVVGKFHQCRRSPVGWLWSVVRTELARYFRGERRAADVDAGIADCRERPEDQAERNEEQLRMRSALGELPAEHQRIIYMKFYQDMRNVEIAEATGLTPSYVGVLVHRSLKRLQALMEGARAGGRPD